MHEQWTLVLWNPEAMVIVYPLQDASIIMLQSWSWSSGASQEMWFVTA